MSVLIWLTLRAAVRYFDLDQSGGQMDTAISTDLLLTD